jgi:protein-tyrosine phosphatase
MIDVHSHILFDIDDGSKSIEESIQILKEYEKNGINSIILTPHYIYEGIYQVTNKEKIKKYNELKNSIEKEKINIKVYLGNEIYACDNILQLLEEDKIMSLNNSRYVLIEFPIYVENKQSYNIIYNLVLSGYVPVIAHPERYKYVWEDFNILNKYIENGALLQINKDSFFGKYGKNAKKIVKKIIKKRLATCIGTDIHSINNTIFSNDKLKRKIIRLSNKEYCYRITLENSNKIINDEIITK